MLYSSREAKPFVDMISSLVKENAFYFSY
jgi:phosphatidylinositol 4-phosphatase